MKHINGSDCALLQSVAIVTKKLLVDDKITACVKEISLLGVLCKVSNRKT